MDHHKALARQRLRRRRHVRRAVRGTPARPRLSIFRSSKHIYAQLIDDEAGVTLASASSQSADLKGQVGGYGGNVKAAQAVGAALAAAATAKGITLAAFDRGHYKFHGRVKALAEAANAAGLKCCERKPEKLAKLEREAAAAAAAAKDDKAGGKAEKGEKKKAKEGGKEGKDAKQKK